MIPLPQTYKMNSFEFKIIERDEDTAIAEQWDIDGGERKFVAYEVFEIIKKPERVLFGETIPANEKVPSNEQWGTYGFSCWTIERAREKREFLRKQMKTRIENR